MRKHTVAIAGIVAFAVAAVFFCILGLVYDRGAFWAAGTVLLGGIPISIVAWKDGD